MSQEKVPGVWAEDISTNCGNIPHYQSPGEREQTSTVQDPQQFPYQSAAGALQQTERRGGGSG